MIKLPSTKLSIDNRDEVINTVQKCVEGDSAAWRELFESFKDLMVNIIRKEFSTYRAKFNDEDVEDILCICWQKLAREDCKNLRKTLGRYPGYYIGAVASNTAKSYLRSSGYKKIQQTKEMPPDPEEQEGFLERFRSSKSLSSAEAEDILEHPRAETVLNEAVSLLTPREKLIFKYKATRFGAEGYLDDTEISEISGYERYTISRIWKRSREKISEYFMSNFPVQGSDTPWGKQDDNKEEVDEEK